MPDSAELDDTAPGPAIAAGDGPIADPPHEPSLWDRFGMAGPLAVAALVMPPAAGFILIGYMKTIAQYLRSHADVGPLLYAGAFAALAGLALMPTYAQSALGGFAFGFPIGLAAALVGFVGGAIIGYEIARRASGDKVMHTIRSKPQWNAVRNAFVSGSLAGRGFWKTLGAVALLRLPPNSPFAITNLVMASVRVPRLPYVIGTFIGMAPRTAAAVWVGSQLSDLGSDGIKTPLWLTIVGIAASIIVLGIVGLIASTAIRRVTGVDMRPRAAREQASA